MNCMRGFSSDNEPEISSTIGCHKKIILIHVCAWFPIQNCHQKCPHVQIHIAFCDNYLPEMDCMTHKA